MDRGPVPSESRTARIDTLAANQAFGTAAETSMFVPHDDEAARRIAGNRGVAGSTNWTDVERRTVGCLQEYDAFAHAGIG